MAHSLSSESQAAPVPTVETPCVVCGASGHRIVCPAQEIEAHHRYLERFHIQEERLVKLVCRMVSRTESVWRGTSVTAPWLDLFYRKPTSPR